MLELHDLKDLAANDRDLETLRLRIDAFYTDPVTGVVDTFAHRPSGKDGVAAAHATTKPQYDAPGCSCIPATASMGEMTSEDLPQMQQFRSGYA